MCLTGVRTTCWSREPSGPGVSAAITMDGYTAAHQVMNGSPILPTTTGMRRRFVLGAIANIGIITLQAREPTMTEAALEAFPN